FKKSADVGKGRRRLRLRCWNRRTTGTVDVDDDYADIDKKDGTDESGASFNRRQIETAHELHSSASCYHRENHEPSHCQICHEYPIGAEESVNAAEKRRRLLRRQRLLKRQTLVLSWVKRIHYAQTQLLKQKQKSDDVQIQHKIKQDSEQFRAWKASREKEVMQVLIQAIEHEIEVTVRVHVVRSGYERQTEERTRMAKEVARLREENDLLKNAKISVHGDTMSPGARNSRIFALENMLATSSNTLVSMASQLSEAEERERVFGGRGRWNQVRTLGDVKSIMNYLFNLASTARCLARDKEADCREKDVLRRGLKEKIVKFSSYVRYMEIQNSDLVHQVKALTSAMKKLSAENNRNNEHNLKKQETRNSIIVLEDMDTSDSEESDNEREDPDIDDEWKPELESERDSEQESAIKLNRKRHFKVGRRRSSVVMRRSYEENSEAPSDDAVKSTSSSDVCCCTCSKSSSWKTMKCQCRATKGSCGPSCGYGKQNNPISESEALENGENSQESDEKHKEQQQQTNDDRGTRRRRKPLSDIGNTTGKSNVPRPSQRKKWKKTVLQLIPVGPPATPALPQEEANPVDLDVERATKPENSDAGESMKLKLPRAMRTIRVGQVEVELQLKRRTTPVGSKEETETVVNSDSVVNPLRQVKLLKCLKIN
ncbi:hypothetical protein CARUB_v10024603mg, partial [Capsella rubella]